MRARMIGAVVAAVVVSGSLLAALYAGDPDAGVWLHLAMALLWTFTLGVALAYREERDVLQRKLDELEVRDGR